MCPIDVLLNFFILILNCVFFCNQHQILTYTVICF
jgi:hypothetical protein